MALEMNDRERAERMRRNLEFSLRLTTVAWATEVLRDLSQVQKSNDASAYSALGFGMGFRVMGVKAGFLPINTVDVSRAYRKSNHRLILLDWGGTLVAEGEKVDKLQFYAVAQGHASRSGPSDALKHLLRQLCADSKNYIFVVSGKELPAVSEAFEEVPGLGLGAEHGFFYRWPTDSTSNSSATPGSPKKGSSSKAKWQTMVALGDQSWKEVAKMVMNVYVQRTHGTYVEHKGNALIWQFRDADPEFGYLQSKELEENLSHVMSAYEGVDVLRGGGVSDGYIEVRPSGISKGLFLDHVMSKLDASDVKVDFVLTIGDDISDEPMFEHLERLLTNESAGQGDALKGFSVTVGKKPSAARSYVDDPGAVMELLIALNKASAYDREGGKGFGSMNELSQLTEGLTDLGRTASVEISTTKAVCIA